MAHIAFWGDPNVPDTGPYTLHYEGWNFPDYSDVTIFEVDIPCTPDGGFAFDLPAPGTVFSDIPGAFINTCSPSGGSTGTLDHFTGTVTIGDMATWWASIDTLIQQAAVPDPFGALAYVGAGGTHQHPDVTVVYIGTSAPAADTVCPVFVGTISPGVVNGTTIRIAQTDPRGASIWMLGDKPGVSYVEEYSYPGLAFLQTFDLADGLGTALDFFGGDGSGGVVYMDHSANIARWNGGHSTLLSPYRVRATWDQTRSKIVNVSELFGAGPYTIEIRAVDMAGTVTLLASFTSTNIPGQYNPIVTPDGAVWWTEGPTDHMARWTAPGGYQSSVDQTHSQPIPRPDNTVWATDAVPRELRTHPDFAGDLVVCADLTPAINVDWTGTLDAAAATVLLIVQHDSGGVFTYDIWKLQKPQGSWNAGLGARHRLPGWTVN